MPSFPLPSEFRPSQKLASFPHVFVCFFFFSSESDCLFLCACLGFTTQQAEIIVSALVKITDTSMDIVYNDMVTKVQQVRWAGWIGTLEVCKQNITHNKYSSSFSDTVLLRSVW